MLDKRIILAKKCKFEAFCREGCILRKDGGMKVCDSEVGIFVAREVRHSIAVTQRKLGKRSSYL